MNPVGTICTLILRPFICELAFTVVMMGSGQKIYAGLGQISHLWIWKTSQIFQFFPLLNKEDLSGSTQKYLGQRRVGHLFTVGQKYSWVGSGLYTAPISYNGEPLFYTMMYILLIYPGHGMNPDDEDNKVSDYYYEEDVTHLASKDMPRLS